MNQGHATAIVHVNLLFFAKSRELAGTPSQSNFPLPVTSGGSLNGRQVLALICDHFPELRAIRDNVIIAHNEEYCEDLTVDIPLRNGDEIAVIPPIAGGQARMGSNYLKLTFDKLDVGELNDLVAHESCGAVALFVGTTRDNFDGKQVVLLQYEAYEAMALKSMNHICEELRNRWPDIVHVGIHHRLGTVPVKEASVVIAISSPHREASLEAVRYAIDELKKSVPVWKKEQYAEGQGCSEWKENKECSWSKAYKDQHIL